MKLYIKEESGRNIYLNKVVSTRTELREIVGRNDFKVNGKKYYIQDVKAAKDSNDTFKGVVVGGLIGAFAGPLGIVFGGAAGAIIGNNSDRRRIKNVERFNKSRNRWAKQKR